ncbi:MAG: polysaccharide biosynthesis protein [Cytophagales bacterium]|nr:MAG: polysaccharide biosynthesis protein [Cytophagales bacterium]
MSFLKKLLSDTALYGVSSIVGRVFNYFLVPLYTAVLAPEEFGIQAELYIYVAFLNIIYTFGLETTFFRFCRDEDNQLVYERLQSFLLLYASVLSLGLWLMSENIAAALGYWGEGQYISMLAGVLWIDTILVLSFAKLRQEKKAKQFALIKIFNISINILLNVFFLLVCPFLYEGRYLGFLQPIIASFYVPNWGINYIFFSNLIANALQIPFFYKHFFRLRFSWNYTLLKPMLVYAYPLIFMGLAGMLNSMTDRIMLKYWLPTGFYPQHTTMAAVGIYAAAYKLSIFMSLAIQAFKYAAEPFFFDQSKKEQSPEIFAKVMFYFVLACLSIFLVVSLNTKWLEIIFLRKSVYREAMVVVPILLLANMFLGIYYNLSIWFKLKDKTHFGTWISVGAAVATILLNLIFIPLGGYLACAVITLVVYFAMAVACYIIGNYHYPIPYPINKIGIHIMIGIIIFMFSSIIDVNLPLWVSIAFNNGLLLTYFLFLVYLWKSKQKWLFLR